MVKLQILKMKNKNIILMKKCDNWLIPINDKSSFPFDSNWFEETLNIENKGKIIKKKIGYYGIVFCYVGINKIN